MIEVVEQIRSVAKRVIMGSAAVLLIVSTPAPVYVYADEPVCSPVVATPGIQKPTGSDAVTYTYNSCTGLWESPHYTWSPATKQRTPIDPVVYVYNSTTGKWDYQTWNYSPGMGKWVQSTLSVTQPPEGAQTEGGPSPIAPSQSDPDQQSGTGPGSNGEQTIDNANNTNIDNKTNTSVINTLGSIAVTGAASVSGNTLGGNAASGNAQAAANVINMLQSSSALGSTAATFTANIDGDVQGDLIIDPSALQPAATHTDINSTNNLKLNVANDGQITNNLNLAATTGDASVTNNTKAGNATSGNAQAVANVVNMINSMISANQSFLGVVNINGNFNGNILMPQKFLDSLIASNAPHSDVTLSQNAINNAVTNISNNTSIANNVSSTATSGAATVAGNTDAGSATSGNAKTNVTIFDLTGVQTTGGNVMLVFVNVLGKWVGVLMNAPAGSTAAAFGGGLTNGSVNSVNNTDVNAANDGRITNNIDTAATSGAATVANNNTAGNATSGDAETAINLSNITNSTLDLTGWFGILFINVFGNWNGNFGVITSQAKNAATAAAGPAAVAATPVFGFAPSAGKSSGSGSTGSNGNGDTMALDAQLVSVASSVKGTGTTQAFGSSHDSQITHGQKNQALYFGIGLFALGLVILVIDQIRGRQQTRAK